MMSLDTFMAYQVGHTPLLQAASYCATGNIFVKLETQSQQGNIKERAAYYMIRNLILEGHIVAGSHLVESSSGNLGLSLGVFARELGLPFTCLIDPTLPPEKVKLLEAHGIETECVELADHSNYRDARIARATELSMRPGWIWTHQYDNPSNAWSHFETTGPEIYAQMDGRVDYVICAVGSGGTVCGIGLCMKTCKGSVQTPVIVAVEPDGSTIFGGHPHPYLSAGAGMSYAPGLVTRFGHVIDYFCQVEDAAALHACLRFRHAEGVSVGITTGSTLAVATSLAERHPDRRIVVIAADAGESYASQLANAELAGLESLPPWHGELRKYVHGAAPVWPSAVAAGKRKI